MNKENWVWMPHNGHFICGDRCHFTLNTYIGKYIVSTIGELPETLKEYIKDKKFMSQFQEIGCGRKYETMVWKAKRSVHECCPWEIIVADGELDFEAYNTAGDAYKGHLKLCNKWSKK